jgi:flagellar basal body-associated protein FliL
MEQKEGTNRRTEVWTILLAVAVVVVALGAVMMFFMLSG